MEIKEVTAKEYQDFVKEYVTVFEKPGFNELNKHKCKEVLYLLFVDEKYRFGVIAGITNENILKIPFSAPFSLLTPLKKNNKVMAYNDAVIALKEYCKIKNYKGIYITLPPKLYSETVISNLENALFINGFKIDKIDLNFHYCLDDFDENYLKKCERNAQKNLKNALSFNLSFEKAVDVEKIKEAYGIIAQNRKEKGYPLHMSEEDVFKTIKLINADFFIVRNEEKEGIASAQIFEVAEDIMQVIYWGNISGSEKYRVMNFLSYKVFEFYKKEGKKIVDIGPSTENGVPNTGLCDFKQSIGCKTNSKYSFSLELE